MKADNTAKFGEDRSINHVTLLSLDARHWTRQWFYILSNAATDMTCTHCTLLHS